MSFTNPGWHLLSTTTQQTWSQATNAWGISTSTVYKYIYELKNAPIQTGVTLTKDNWTQIDITTNPTLMPMTAYIRARQYKHANISRKANKLLIKMGAKR